MSINGKIIAINSKEKVVALWITTDPWMNYIFFGSIPDSKVDVANMGPTWVLSAPGGPHDGPMNLAIRDDICQYTDCESDICLLDYPTTQGWRIMQILKGIGGPVS